MIKRIFYLLISVICVTGAIAIYKGSTNIGYMKQGYAVEKVSKQWNLLIADAINTKGIEVSIDDKIYTNKELEPFVNNDLELMIPYDMVEEVFDCSERIYNKKKIVIEKGTISASININSKEVSFNKKKQRLSSAVVRKDGRLFVPVELFEKAFGYSLSWDKDKSKAKVINRDIRMLALPQHYNYVEKKRIGKPKDQGVYGTCWSFASLTAFESSLMPEENLDFSEEHMVLANSFQSDLYRGGEYTMSLAYLAAWQGPVYESEDTYGDEHTPKNLKARKHLQEVQIIDRKDFNTIKKMLLKYGGVQSSLYTSLLDARSFSSYYNKETYAYCYNGTEKPNHDIVIIGWDDNYSRDNFTVDVKGDGAFICRNSWGSEFGDKGNFYVSYYDTNIGVHNIVYTRIDAPDNYDNIYQTDLCGWVGKLGYTSSESAYFSNIYRVKKKESLAAVSFYSTVKDAEYEVYVCKNFKNKEDLKARGLPVAKGKLTNSGYYTIDLSDGIYLERDEKYAVIVKMDTPNSTKPIAIEYKNDYQTEIVDLSDGEGYFSLKGEKWESAEEGKFNICLKAFTNNIK